jgi:pyridoxamine 5'-phosphate oxidase
MPADQSDAPAIAQNLPDPLPADPFPLFQSWFDEAYTRRIQPNPNAMSLATVDADGTPSARIVLCKHIRPELGAIVFFTNYRGRKGRALQANPRAGVCFHWDPLDRQVRLEGHVTRSPEAESDKYFASRPLESQLGAWASDQSEPIESRDALFEKAAITMAKFCDDPALKPGDIPVIHRPPHWGGFRLWVTHMEFWVGGIGRMHDRAGWTRPLAPTTIDGVPGYAPSGDWRCTRLQP